MTGLKDMMSLEAYALSDLWLYRQNKKPAYPIPEFVLEPHPTDSNLVVPKYTRGGCEALSCYWYPDANRICTTLDPPQTLVRGGRSYPVCQESCFKYGLSDLNGNQPRMPDVFWAEGKCKLLNMSLKRFCLEPGSRQQHFSDVEPPPFAYDPVTEDCIFTEEYCRFYGDYLDSDDCHTASLQRVGEAFVGETLSKLKSLVERKRPRRDLEDFGIQQSYDIATSTLETLMKRQITKLAAVSVGEWSIIESVNMLNFAFRMQGAALGILNAFSVLTTVADILVFAAGIGGMILDHYDPYGLGQQHNRESVNDMRQLYHFKMSGILNNEYEYMPNDLYGTPQNEEEQAYYNQRVQERFLEMNITSTGDGLFFSRLAEEAFSRKEVRTDSRVVQIICLFLILLYSILVFQYHYRISKL